MLFSGPWWAPHCSSFLSPGFADTCLLSPGCECFKEEAAQQEMSLFDVTGSVTGKLSFWAKDFQALLQPQI